MFPLLLPLAGAGLGAILSKNDPLKGALLGAGAGALGGAAFAPSAAAAGTGFLGATSPTMVSAPAVAEGAGLLGSATPAFASAPEVMQGAGMLGGEAGGLAGAWDKVAAAGKSAMPVMNAAATGLGIANAMSPQRPQVSPASPIVGNGGSPVLAQLAQGQEDPAMAQRAAMMAQRRATMWG